MSLSQSKHKIICPILPPTILYRQALIDALAEAISGKGTEKTEESSPYKLVLICAPAGYGKTTLLADFARHSTIPCCWYSLDHSDRDALTFLEFLIATIRQVFPEIGNEAATALLSLRTHTEQSQITEQDLYEVIDVLIKDMAASLTRGCCIILRNYQEVNSSCIINTLVNYVLQSLPFQCVLIIESRVVPSLKFASLLSQSEMFGIGSNNLRFTEEDIRTLAHLQGITDISNEEIEQIMITFQGWIAGILLGTRLGDLQCRYLEERDRASWGSPAIRMDKKNVFAYLFDEVFMHEADLYNFLMQVAIFEQMTPQLCNELLDISQAATFFIRLEQQGMFVSRCGTEDAYTCHPLLRDFLLQRLKDTDYAHFIRLHQRAAHIFHRLQHYEEAVLHASEAKNYNFVAELVLEASRQMPASGDTQRIVGWLDFIPASTLQSYPQLLLLRANIHLHKGEYMLAQPLLEQVLSQVQEQQIQGEEYDTELLASVLIAQSTALFQTGEYAHAQETSQQAFALLSPDQTELRAEVYLRLGTCANLQGNVTEGVAYLQKALHVLGHRTQIRQTAKIHSLLANSYDMLGNLALSEHHRQRAITSWEELDDEQGKINNLIGMGVTRHRQGEYEQARAIFQEAIERSRIHPPFQRGEAYALVSLGDLYQDQGLYTQALAVAEEGLVLARQLNDHYLINCTLCMLAMTYLFMGDVATAGVMVNEAEERTKTIQGYERLLTLLTRGTIQLYQHACTDAARTLTQVEKGFKAIGMKREYIQSALRLAACRQIQGNASEARYLVDEAIELAVRNGYDHLVQVEIQRYPVLSHIPSTHSSFVDIPSTEGRVPEVNTIIQGVAMEVEAPSREKNEYTGWHIYALGEPGVVIDGEPVTRWRMAHAMELFFFLLDRGQPVRKDQIINALWPEGHIQSDQTLRSTVYYLRKAIGESMIIHEPGVYALNLTEMHKQGLHYDVNIFLSCFARAKEALEAGCEEEAYVILQEMVELYRGDYGQSFYSDWCIPRREELRNAYIDARRQLAHLAWQQKRYEECLLHWQNLLEVDNCLEEAHYGVMISYVRLKKRNLALRQYQRCVSTLQKELGSLPGTSIQKLYQQLTNEKKKSS